MFKACFEFFRMSLIRGYLKSPGHSYILEEDVVSIGKGSDNKIVPPPIIKNARAHIPISIGKADPYHAVVVKEPEKNCYYLTDLNTAYGTYVNETRLQNKTVELKAGDQIRFGYGGVIYEFGLCQNEAKEQSQIRLNTPHTKSLKSSNQPRPVSAHNSSSTMINFSNLVRPETAPLNRNVQVYKVNDNKRSTSVPINMKTTEIKYGDDAKTITSDKHSTSSSQHLPNLQEGWSVDEQDINELCEKDTTYSKVSSWDKEQNEAEPWYVFI